MTIKNPQRNVYRVFATYGWGLAAGMTDGVLGSLLPFIESIIKSIMQSYLHFG